MSRELITWVEVKNEKGEWHTLKLFNELKEDVTDRFLFFNYAKEKLCTTEGLTDYLRGFPSDCSNDIMNSFKDCGTENDIYSFEAYNRATTWYDWCELQALSRTPEAWEVDWYAVDETDDEVLKTETLPKINNVEEVVKRIELLMEMNGIYSYNVTPGEVRIVCFLSF